MTGYLHENYAHSLAEFGTARQLPQSGAWILERAISGSSHRDAMACYPLFCCRDWSKLQDDLDNIGQDLISLSIVTDPFGNYSEAGLKACFPDKVIPFKQHFIIDLQQPVDELLSTNHRRNIRRALSIVEVEICLQPMQYLEEWVALYDHLIERHDITGMRRFSANAFREQFKTPGLTVFRAHQDGKTVGMILWFQHGEVGYYHLAAYNGAGYDAKASFALFQHAIEHFSQAGLRYLNLGAGSGVQSGRQDGLTRFKSGWSTGTRTAYFCGRVFDPGRYTEIRIAKGMETSNYFPAYRQGEFI